MSEKQLTAPVLLVFFNRPTTFEKVFEKVRTVRPMKLYLYQDGPREDKFDSDKFGIEACRAIVDGIDWDCEIHKWYQEKNVGCDPSGFMAHSWLLENEEYGIIIEDDIVADPSFFYFCQELLEKYKNDKRVYKICGMNIEGISEEIDTSYFFSRKGSIWGWATWKRVAKLWDSNYSFLNNPESLKILQNSFESKMLYNEFIRRATVHRNSGKAHFETINYACKMLNGMLDLVPKENLISNIGASDVSVHSSEYHLTPKGLRVVYNGKRYPMQFPMKHPKNVEEHSRYYKVVNRVLGLGHPFVMIYRRFEELFYKLRYTPVRSWLSLIIEYKEKIIKKIKQR